MTSILVGTLVALAAAVLVLVLASVAGGREGGPAGLLATLRGGIQQVRGGRPLVTTHDDAVDDDLDEFFAATEVDEDPYLRVDDLTGTWGRVRARAVRGVAHARR
ncbi:hypothetical protein [Cellulomonas fimi]|uniref:Uncharacterized protein n=1 Tax=Cellulomonas fimi TaxID=1708 RepID=A0A7Y0QH77_CELFI|nr:hypothetical protein [Cellulomonas fimi]NMR19604.1 hypothetical protein [Cellulomonas fimi]